MGTVCATECYFLLSLDLLREREERVTDTFTLFCSAYNDVGDVNDGFGGDGIDEVNAEDDELVTMRNDHDDGFVR